MTDTDALDAGLMAAATQIVDDMIRPLPTSDERRELRDAILAALRSERVRGEESMRERAAKVAADRSERVLDIIERETNNNRRHLVEGFDQRVAVAASIATAIKALPTTDQETTHG